MSSRSPRRSFLSRVGLGAGAALLGPMFRDLESSAWAAPPKRLVLFLVGNGASPNLYKSQATSETSFVLPYMFSPLQRWANRSIYASSFDAPHSWGQHGQAVHVLSGVAAFTGGSNQNVKAGGATFDQFVAERLSAGVPVKAFVGSPRLKGDVVLASGPNTPVPEERDPQRAFNRLFGAGVPGGPTSMPTAASTVAFDRDLSVLDAMKADVARMNQALAPAERPKLDQYLTSIRELERQIGGLRANAASPTAAPTPAMDCRALTAPAGVAPTDPVEVVSPERCQAFADLAANTLVCGLTRVSVVTVYPDAPYEKYFGSNVGHHSACHGDDYVLPSGKRYVEQIRFFQSELVARIAARLDGVPEGTGTMLDNTLIVYLNSGGGGHHSSSKTHMVALIGGTGGSLRMGRYLQYPTRSLNDLWTSVANALGIGIDKYGDPAVCAGPLPGFV